MDNSRIINFYFIKQFVFLINVSMLIAVSFAYGETFDLKAENKKHEKMLLEKIENDIILTSDDINQLAGILSFNKEYLKGIEIFEKLGKNERYKERSYLIYFNLAVFYIEESYLPNNKETKQMYVNKAQQNVDLGFKDTPDKPLAFYLRSNIYGIMGCNSIARDDLMNAIEAAESKETILFSEGIYLSKERFIKIVDDTLEGIKLLEDHCILEEKN